MAELSQSLVALRVGGDDLDPQHVTQVLGCEPTLSARKGGSLHSGKAKAKTGTWQLEATDRSPADLDGQIRDILNRTTQDLSQWEKLNGSYSIDLYCGLFMKESAEDVELSSSSLKLIAERGISLYLCLYGPLANSDA